MSRRRAWECHGGRARKTAWLGALASCSLACAHQAPVGASAAQIAADAEREALRVQLAERDRRIGQLENRIALLEAGQRELRYRLVERDMAASEPPAVAAPAQRGGQAAQARAEPVDEGARPVLRLYEDKRRPSTSSQASLMPVPQVDERLPVAPLPSLKSVIQTVESQQQQESAEDLYRRAIDLVRRRDFGGSLRVLDEFLQRFAGHALAPKVMFWRGEVLFAQRAYERALSAYEAALARDPRGEKAPDALLKIGLCHRQLGSLEGARRALERLKTEFPKSDAARLIQEEDV